MTNEQIAKRYGISGGNWDAAGAVLGYRSNEYQLFGAASAGVFVSHDESVANTLAATKVPQMLAFLYAIQRKAANGAIDLEVCSCCAIDDDDPDGPTIVQALAEILDPLRENGDGS